jgi:hypothetical protein
MTRDKVSVLLFLEGGGAERSEAHGPLWFTSPPRCATIRRPSEGREIGGVEFSP